MGAVIQRKLASDWSSRSSENNAGFSQLELISKLYPLHRTLVSDDTDLALNIIAEHLPKEFKSSYSIVSIPSGTQCWTWEAPKKYIVREATLRDSQGNILIDFNDNALHLVSYSHAVNARLSFEELDAHLHYSKKRPNAIPWKFYYYVDNWGLCLAYNDYLKLDKSAEYQVVIDVDFVDDSLKIGELLIPGESESEFLIITNICHPYQVNDSITGVSTVLDFLYKLRNRHPKISLRILFLPETIGSICYFATREGIEKHIKFAMFLEMLGNDYSLALQKSFQGDSYIDKAMQYVLQQSGEEFRSGEFREIVGNDELVTNGPGLNIPTISLSRSKISGDSFPEYHTSDDKPEILIKKNLDIAAEILFDLFNIMDSDYIPRRTFKGPICLSRYGLWGVWCDLDNGKEVVDQIMYRLEGDQSVFEIAIDLGVDYCIVKSVIDKFFECKLVEKQMI